MGRGGGQCTSSQKAPAVEERTVAVANSVPAAAASPKIKESLCSASKNSEITAKMPKLAIIYYSMYGHIRTLAESIKKGAEDAGGVEVSIFQVAESLPEAVLTMMHAPPKSDHPIINAHDLEQYDGFVFGFPTRFGMMAAQMKQLFDATGGLWMKGGLLGKPAGMFTCTASQGSGMETTIMTAITQLAHHGMVFVPIGYGAGACMNTLDEVKGGSPWGSGTIAGATGARQPSALELETAVYQGKIMANITKKLAA